MIRVLIVKFRDFFSKGHERTLLAKKNIFISLFLKGLSISLGFAIVPITINYINPEQYGLWLTLSSIIGWLNFFDIGLANGLKNKLAETIALNEQESSRIYVSTTYAILGIIALFLFSLFFVINPFLNWGNILNFPNINGLNLNSLALVVFGIFCIQFVVQIINTVLTACHYPSKVSLISFFGQLISVVIIYILSFKPRISLVYIVSILAGVPLIVQFFYSLYYFKYDFKQFRPNFKSVQFKHAKGLLKVGGVFFLIQLGALILLQTDNILIIRLFGAKEVTIFNLAFKLYSVVTMVFTIILTPFWSAFTDAYVKKDFDWIKMVIKKMQLYWLILSACTLILFFISPFLFKIWLHGSVILPTSLSFVMALWVMAYCWQTMYVYFLNGAGKIKLQLYLIIGTSIINIPLAILLSKWIGLAGITLSNTIVFVFLGIMYYTQTKLILNNKAFSFFDK